jgi:hypothetical protein
MHLLSYVSRQGIVDKILMVLSSVYYVAAWRVSVRPVIFQKTYVLLIRNSEGAYVLPDDCTWWPKHVGAIDG